MRSRLRLHGSPEYGAKQRVEAGVEPVESMRRQRAAPTRRERESMLHVARKVGQIAGMLLVASFVWSASASAQMREFTGQVDNISEKKVIVDNRKGDKVSFMHLPETTLEGEKTKWEDLKKKDWVTVHWKFTDNPRKAYKVVVLPPREEAGEEVE
jgi:hypothetical protein